MRIEEIKKANKILEEIRFHEKAIENLQRDPNLYCELVCMDVLPSYHYETMFFEEWEIKLIIHQKKQKIERLRKELEAM